MYIMLTQMRKTQIRYNAMLYTTLTSSSPSSVPNRAKRGERDYGHPHLTFRIGLPPPPNSAGSTVRNPLDRLLALLGGGLGLCSSITSTISSMGSSGSGSGGLLTRRVSSTTTLSLCRRGGLRGGLRDLVISIVSLRLRLLRGLLERCRTISSSTTSPPRFPGNPPMLKHV